MLRRHDLVQVGPAAWDAMLRCHPALLVIGSVRHPLAADFASFLLQAQSSRAKIVGLANAGSDTTNSGVLRRSPP
jgi:hypothetical protein